MNHNDTAVRFIWGAITRFQEEMEPSELWRIEGSLFCVGNWITV